jgi:hypothetical protein
VNVAKQSAVNRQASFALQMMTPIPECQKLALAVQQPACRSIEPPQRSLLLIAPACTLCNLLIVQSTAAEAAASITYLLHCRAQTLSWQPRLLLHHNLLTAQECDALVALRTNSAQGTGVEQV